MSKINILDSSIYNKISAGEVVENPASVVKELVENSIDAGATSITVEICGGGIDKIKISDNGDGIDFAELKSAFLPHATSKISTTNDLDAIETLGFRGEALASIASISKVKLVSKPKNQDLGGSIEIEGGEVISITETGCPNGTYITISNLFYNTPARRKFLKKPMREEATVTTLVEQFILANYEISFKYIVDGVIVYQSSGNGIQDAIFTVYKKEALENSVYFEKQSSDIKIYGYLGKFDFSKPNRTYQTLVVNGRVVQNITISTAVYNMYEPYLMKRRYPFYVIFLQFPFEKIDVNVHPRKTEIKFDDNSLVYKLITAFIDDCFNEKQKNQQIVEVTDIYKNSVQEKQPNNSIKQPTPISNSNCQTTIISEAIQPTQIIQTLTKQPVITEKQVINKQQILAEKPAQTELSNTKYKPNITDFYMQALEGTVQEPLILSSPGEYFIVPEQSTFIEDIICDYKLVGQLFDTYILLQYGEKLLVIDQHAGHERLLYDKLINNLDSNFVQQQALLIPYIFNVNTKENDYLVENLQVFIKQGFDIEQFGKNTFKINAVPLVLSDINLGEFCSLMLENLQTQKSGLSNYINEKLMQCACKSAIKAGKELEKREIDILISSFSNGDTLLCPHGRPIIVEIDKKSIEKWFKRIV